MFFACWFFCVIVCTVVSLRNPLCRASVNTKPFRGISGMSKILRLTTRPDTYTYGPRRNVVMKRILALFVVCGILVFNVGNMEARAEEPSLSQCKGEPSKGTGWGTFWIVYGALNAAGGFVIMQDDSGRYENPKAIGIGAIAVGGILNGIGWHKRSSEVDPNVRTVFFVFLSVFPPFLSHF